MHDQNTNRQLEQAFRLDDTTEITVLGTVDEPLFIASQVARALGYRDAANMVRRLDEDDRGTRSVSTPGGEQNVTVITEAGLYAAVLGSQVESAKAFKRWVTHTVLPEIRRTGSYNATPALPMSEEEIVLHALTIQNRKIAALSAKVAEDRPKVEAWDELMESDGTYSFLAASKILGWGRNTMMRDLRRMGILQGNNLPYQRYEHHFKVIPGTYVNRKTGQTVPTATAYVRPSGIAFLRKKLNQAPSVVAVPEAVGA